MLNPGCYPFAQCIDVRCVPSVQTPAAKAAEIGAPSLQRFSV